jgi:rSAM/selenodomain-associated transferase 2
MCPCVSIVVPVLHDTAELARLLSTLEPHPSTEIIVVSGAHDPALAPLERSRPDVRWMTSTPGRGIQLNQGARHAGGRWLVFLHADCRLGAGWLAEIEGAEASGSIAGGSFRFRLDSPRGVARLIEWGVRQRVRWLDLPYGDQALFVRRDVFERLGGFRPLALMEDVDFVQRLRKVGRLLHAATPVMVSPRRWERDGWLRRTLGNLMLLVLFQAGVSPARLARWYYR